MLVVQTTDDQGQVEMITYHKGRIHRLRFQDFIVANECPTEPCLLTVEPVLLGAEFYAQGGYTFELYPDENGHVWTLKDVRPGGQTPEVSCKRNQAAP